MWLLVLAWAGSSFYSAIGKLDASIIDLANNNKNRLNDQTFERTNMVRFFLPENVLQMVI